MEPPGPAGTSRDFRFWYKLLRFLTGLLGYVDTCLLKNSIQRPPVCIPATGSIYNRMASLLAGTPPMPPAPSPPANDFGKATPTSTQSNNNDDPKPKREQQDIQKLRKEIEDPTKPERCTFWAPFCVSCAAI